MNKTPTTLIIMDGFGLSNDTVGNAVRAANTPVLDGLFAEYAHTTLQASGLDVGLPAGQMGNSEVGHTNIGGGRVVFQDLPRITRSIEDGTFFENPAYNKAMDDCIEKGSALHLYGLHSTGGVHSTLDHLYALLKMAHIKGLKRVYIHAFLDGRDTPPTSGRDFVAKTMEKCRELGVGKIATVMGRYYAMDRDKRWDRLENAYDALVYGEGVQDSDPIHAIEESYKNGVTDEFVEPIVCDKDGMISDNDSVIFFNYRPDRAREITRAFVDPAFDGFKREFFPLTYVCNTEYDATMPNVLVAFPRISVKNGLGEYLSKMGMTQLRIAETEKYAHVTFFFNGGVEDPYPGEDRVLVASPKVATYDLQPEMSAYEVAAIQDKGVHVVMKHFALNDCEQDRIGLGVWVNEQAAREVYLKAFQAPVEVGNANGVMIAYTRWGAVWSGGNYGLVTGILRNEWGCDGMVITDNVLTQYVNGPDGVMAGVSIYDAMMSFVTDTLPKYKNDPVIVTAMREACHHNLYAIANSCGMNGVGADTTIKVIRPTIVAAVIAVARVSGILFVLGLILWILGARKLRKTEQYKAYKDFKKAQKAAKKAQKAN